METNSNTKYDANRAPAFTSDNDDEFEDENLALSNIWIVNSNSATNLDCIQEEGYKIATLSVDEQRVRNAANRFTALDDESEVEVSFRSK